MGTLQVQGEKLRKAVQWVSDEKKKNPGISDISLVDQAAVQFDLTPEDSEFLARFIKSSREE
ncbi:hypothetical protein SAMN02746065_110111 [Desulfocicer vacuolatum DSM 3385]|uniref:Uncharacterized protein n=1 Tax=Desulfocicer vacuolatum DSM 3385 TaxID=1121400 RepID=A0A1W2C3I7_9BACT|nr:hypothetical protein [Desulfocicer vacuolatum]SMC79661.1 hypothetical protein SAMN02746065_110111 [Desulfocicer vacuolatum DSM 3385]